MKLFGIVRRAVVRMLFLDGLVQQIVPVSVWMPAPVASGRLSGAKP